MEMEMELDVIDISFQRKEGGKEDMRLKPSAKGSALVMRRVRFTACGD